MLNNLISIENTICEYGYNPISLKPSSEKLVIWHCSNCLEQCPKKFRQAQKNNFCLKCSNKINSNKNLDLRVNKIKEWHKKNEHPLKGTKRPEHVIAAIIKHNTGKIASEETRKKQSKAQSGINNGFYGKHHTKETIDFLRESSKRTTRRGKDSNFYGKKYWPDRKLFNYNGVKYRSNWEVNTAIYFDTNGIKFEYETKIFDLGDTTYTPDFYLTDYNKCIEVKGYWYEDAKEKFNDFKIKYPNTIIEIWDSNKLKSLNISLKKRKEL